MDIRWQEYGSVMANHIPTNERQCVQHVLVHILFLGPWLHVTVNVTIAWQTVKSFSRLKWNQTCHHSFITSLYVSMPKPLTC